MRAVRYYGLGDIRVDEIPEPVLTEGHIKIKLVWNGICGSDLHSYFHGPLPVSPTATEPHYVTHETLPVVMGHEFSGTIAELGQGVDATRFVIGQPVVVQHIISCMEPTCGPCSEGHRNVCPRMTFMGIGGAGGGMAEYIVVEESRVYILPDNVTLDVGSMIEPLCIVWHAVKRSSFKEGDNVLIIGGGPIGLILLKVLRALNASWIGVSEPSSIRRNLASAHGASATLNPLTTDITTETLRATHNHGADVVFDCAGVKSGLESALSAVRPRGNIVNIAVWEKPVNIDLNLILAKEVTYTGITGYDNVHEEVIEALASGKITGLETLITRRIPFEDLVEKGIKALVEEKDVHVKILVHP